MHADSIAIERSANAYAFEKIGFKVGKVSKPKAKAAETTTPAIPSRPTRNIKRKGSPGTAWTWGEFMSHLKDSERTRITKLLNFKCRESPFSLVVLMDYINNPSKLRDDIIKAKKEEEKTELLINYLPAERTEFFNRGREDLYEILLDMEITNEVGDRLKTLDDLPKDPTDKAKELGDITTNNIKI